MTYHYLSDIQIYSIVMLAVIFLIGNIWQQWSILNMAKKLKNKSLAFDKLLSQKKSSEVRLGQISEHMAPFLKDFKYDAKKARFIGNPIDYVIFENDKIIFLEVKSGKSRLSKSQAEIRDTIAKGNVEFDTIRID